MAYAFPEGSKFLFTDTFGSDLAVTALTNANPAVATSVGHGLQDGDEIVLTSAWEDASNTVFRVDQLTTDTFGVTGLDTTDTAWFTTGGGAGSVQKASNWVEIPQVLTIATSGGDPRVTTISPLSRRNAISVPTGFNPQSITLTLGHDASDPNYQKMVAVSRTLRKVAFKMVLSGGSTSYGYGYLAVSELPQLNTNQANQVTASFSLLGRSISYS